MNMRYGSQWPRNKYNAKKAFVNVEEFDSKKEARRYQQLHLAAGAESAPLTSEPRERKPNR